MKRFPEKRAVITGAGSGLGRCLALELARDGWRIAVADINEEAAGETVRLVREAGGEAFSSRADVSKAEDVEALAAAVRDRWAGVDVVFNNAGVAGVGRIEEIPLSDWEWILSINLMGVVHGCRAFSPLLAEQGGGQLVNIGSLAGIASAAEMASYNVSKAAVVSLSETLRIELAPKGIGVTVAVPMFFKTNLLDSFRATDESQLQTAKAMMDRAPVTAETVARKVLAGVWKNRLYVFTEAQGRVTWFFKRHFPRFYFWAMTLLYRRGVFDLSDEEAK